MTLFLVLSATILLGCSSDKNKGYGQGRGLDSTEEKGQQMFEQRQQKLIEACKDKTEGDTCILESPREEIEGKCKLENDNLLCATNMTMGQR